MGGGPPETFVSALRLQNASFSRPHKSLSLASGRGDLEIAAIARQMRRSFQPWGGVPRRDVLAATDMQVNLSDEDSAARIAYRQARNC